MRQSPLTPFLLAIAGELALGGAAAAASGGIPLEKTPAKVQATVKKELPRAKPGELQIRDHLRPNGKKVYEVDYEAGATDIEVEIAEGGAVKRRRDRVPIGAVPKPVIDTAARERKEKVGVRTAYGVKIVEKDETFYELHFDNAEGRLKLRYEPDGSLIRRTQELNIAALPKPVADTAKRELGAAPLDKAARVTKSDGVSFRVEGGAGPTEMELKIAPDGRLLEREGPGATGKPAISKIAASPAPAASAAARPPAPRPNN
ncbi:MAG: PepSY-like domain-containing protein [Pseudomonadota bacterium]